MLEIFQLLVGLSSLLAYNFRILLELLLSLGRLCNLDGAEKHPKIVQTEIDGNSHSHCEVNPYAVKLATCSIHTHVTRVVEVSIGRQSAIFKS